MSFIDTIKEKARESIKTIVLPAENEADIEEIPQSVRKELHFVLLKNAKEALKYAMEKC